MRVSVRDPMRTVTFAPIGVLPGAARQREPQDATSGRRLIAEDRGGTPQMGHHEVGIAIVVQIADGHAPAQKQFPEVGTGLVRDIVESTRASVAEELRGHRVRHSQRADVVDVPVGHEQVEATVVVGVEKARAKAQSGPTGHEQAGAGGGDLEPTGTGVAVEGAPLLVKVRNEEIDPPIFVVIPRRNAHPGPQLARLVEGNAPSQSHLLELQATEIVEQQVRRLIIRDEDVELAVVVEVGNRQAQTVSRR